MNLPEENENPQLSPVLESIRTDIRMAGALMQNFSMHVINDEVSQFPIYVAYLDEVSLGRPFIKRESMQLNFNYNASILEEFVKRGVILREKVQEFKDTFGDPEERACIFVVLPQEGGFIFVPYDIAEDASTNHFMPSMN
jgi:hypothetical protein